jgi:putative glutamine amidotransferase
MFKKGWLVLSAVPRIFHARVRFGGKCPSIGLAVSDAWPDRYQLRRLPYDLALARAGARVVTLVPSHLKRLDRMLKNIHGLVLAGGEDVHPVHSGAKGHGTRDTNLDRDNFELMLLDKAAEARLPVLCICRGAQLLAVWAAGRLESQDHDAGRMKDHFSTLRRHAWHHVDMRPGTRLWKIFGGKPAHTNSFHHQVIVDPGRLSIAAVAGKEEIEGVELSGERFVVGVQWHPELQAIFSDANQRLFHALVDEARKVQSFESRAADLAVPGT